MQHLRAQRDFVAASIFLTTIPKIEQLREGCSRLDNLAPAARRSGPAARGRSNVRAAAASVLRTGNPFLISTLIHYNYSQKVSNRERSRSDQNSIASDRELPAYGSGHSHCSREQRARAWTQR